jgi:hypothetical protein
MQQLSVRLSNVSHIQLPIHQAQTQPNLGKPLHSRSFKYQHGFPGAQQLRSRFSHSYILHSNQLFKRIRMLGSDVQRVLRRPHASITRCYHRFDRLTSDEIRRFVALPFSSQLSWLVQTRVPPTADLTAAKEVENSVMQFTTDPTAKGCAKALVRLAAGLDAEPAHKTQAPTQDPTQGSTQNSKPDSRPRSLARLLMFCCEELNTDRREAAKTLQFVDLMMMMGFVAARTRFYRTYVWLVERDCMFMVRADRTRVLCRTCNRFVKATRLAFSCPTCLHSQCRRCARHGKDIHDPALDHRRILANYATQNTTSKPVDPATPMHALGTPDLATLTHEFASLGGPDLATLTHEFASLAGQRQAAQGSDAALKGYESAGSGTSPGKTRRPKRKTGRHPPHPAASAASKASASQLSEPRLAGSGARVQRFPCGGMDTADLMMRRVDGLLENGGTICTVCLRPAKQRCRHCRRTHFCSPECLALAEALNRTGAGPCAAWSEVHSTVETYSDDDDDEEKDDPEAADPEPRPQRRPSALTGLPAGGRGVPVPPTIIAVKRDARPPAENSESSSDEREEIGAWSGRVDDNSGAEDDGDSDDSGSAAAASPASAKGANAARPASRKRGSRSDDKSSNGTVAAVTSRRRSTDRGQNSKGGGDADGTVTECASTSDTPVADAVNGGVNGGVVGAADNHECGSEAGLCRRCRWLNRLQKRLSATPPDHAADKGDGERSADRPAREYPPYYYMLMADAAQKTRPLSLSSVVAGAATLARERLKQRFLCSLCHRHRFTIISKTPPLRLFCGQTCAKAANNDDSNHKHGSANRLHPSSTAASSSAAAGQALSQTPEAGLTVRSDEPTPGPLPRWVAVTGLPEPGWVLAQDSSRKPKSDSAKVKIGSNSLHLKPNRRERRRAKPEIQTQTPSPAEAVAPSTQTSGQAHLAPPPPPSLTATVSPLPPSSWSALNEQGISRSVSECQQLTLAARDRAIALLESPLLDSWPQPSADENGSASDKQSSWGDLNGRLRTAELSFKLQQRIAVAKRCGNLSQDKQNNKTNRNKNNRRRALLYDNGRQHEPSAQRGVGNGRRHFLTELHTDMAISTTSHATDAVVRCLMSPLSPATAQSPPAAVPPSPAAARSPPAPVLSLKTPVVSSPSEPAEGLLAFEFYYRPCTWCRRDDRPTRRCSAGCRFAQYCSDDCHQNDWMHFHHYVCLSTFV